MQKIYNEINSIEEEILKISLWHQESNIDRLAKLYTRIQNAKKELYNIIPIINHFDLYCNLKYKIHEDEMTTRILIKEKLGLTTKDDYAELKKLMS